MIGKLSILKSVGLVLLLALVMGWVARPAGAQATGYRLPWRYCTWQKVLQGWGESPSHNNVQMWYAYDFDFAEGAPVRAARGGTVAFVRSGQTVCWGTRICELGKLCNHLSLGQHSHAVSPPPKSLRFSGAECFAGTDDRDGRSDRVDELCSSPALSAAGAGSVDHPFSGSVF